MIEPPPEGLRERKKRRTRLAISDTATRLFAARGFEQVTLAEIADAAEVSVKTIFNHFGSKEELYFDRAHELRTSLRSTLADRGPGVSVITALRVLLAENVIPFPDFPWQALESPEHYEHLRGFLAVQDRSPALRAYRLVLEEDLGTFLLGALADELRWPGEDPALRAFAAMITASLQLRERTLRGAIMARVPPREVRERVQAIVTATSTRLATAFADLDPPDPGNP